MLKRHTPKNIAAPFSEYHHGVEAPAGARLLFISGQIGVAPDGTLPRTIEEQCRHAWENVFRVLRSAGMGPEDLLRINQYCVRQEHIGAIRKMRVEMMGDTWTGSTLLRVASLADPDWLIEIEGVAAKA